jgi:hypothetical protein
MPVGVAIPESHLARSFVIRESRMAFDQAFVQQGELNSVPHWECSAAQLGLASVPVSELDSVLRWGRSLVRQGSRPQSAPMPLGCAPRPE